ncbi:hypothetical protein XENOCAPTIV_007734 [Xenoophorus captivus]|uniref:Uncharacterized protein n=1 Tax=Xenoophorus captivus TaxID=1517983 RepID=A0ABV0S1I5_9TELE
MPAGGDKYPHSQQGTNLASDRALTYSVYKYRIFPMILCLLVGTDVSAKSHTHTQIDTHTRRPSLKASISRLNELFKTAGLFPDPWLCKSHCCQPIKKVQGPHNQ